MRNTLKTFPLMLNNAVSMLVSLPLALGQGLKPSMLFNNQLA